MSMDVCSHIGLSVADIVNDVRGLCMNTLESTHGVVKVVSVDELGVGVIKFLNIEDDTSPNGEIKEKGVSEKCLLSKVEKIGGLEKSLSKCSTFPCSSMSPDAITSEVHDENIKSPGFRSISLPGEMKAVSAMKGSREKRGAAPAEKLRVKWGPDVYDPVPTSVSHVITNNYRRHSSSSKKNYSRNKQKKSSRTTKGKEKKHVRKYSGSGSSNKLEVEDEVVDFPELFCGSSFLKSYGGGGLHLSSVAEAT